MSENIKLLRIRKSDVLSSLFEDLHSLSKDVKQVIVNNSLDYALNNDANWRDVGKLKIKFTVDVEKQQSKSTYQFNVSTIKYQGVYQNIKKYYNEDKLSNSFIFRLILTYYLEYLKSDSFGVFDKQKIVFF